MIQLWQGNCLELMKNIPDGSVDLTVTSPPYDNLREYNGNNASWNEQVWQGVISDLFRVTKQCGVVVWIVADSTIKGSETGTSFKQALFAKECGFNLHDTMIWMKPNPIPRTHNRYEQAFEYMFVFSKEKPKTWNPITEICANAGSIRSGTIQDSANGIRVKKHKSGVISKTKIKSNIWCFANKGHATHPAAFPETIAIDHIMSWSNEGDIVFDPFAGSGTTGVACRNTGRKFIGIELDPKYFEIAKNRIESIA